METEHVYVDQVPFAKVPEKEVTQLLLPLLLDRDLPDQRKREVDLAI
jgi:hypothetical protein